MRGLNSLTLSDEKSITGTGRTSMTRRRERTPHLLAYSCLAECQVVVHGVA